MCKLDTVLFYWMIYVNVIVIINQFRKYMNLKKQRIMHEYANN